MALPVDDQRAAHRMWPELSSSSKALGDLCAMLHGQDVVLDASLDRDTDLQGHGTPRRGSGRVAETGGVVQKAALSSLAVGVFGWVLGLLRGVFGLLQAQSDFASLVRHS